MEIKYTLKSLGLSENESKIYLALLEMGSRSTGVISRRTGLHRRTVYDSIDRLIKKGLIGYILENGKKVFSASSPGKLTEMIKEKENHLENSLPELMSIFNSSKEKQREDTRFFKGKEGLKSIFEEQLADKSEILILGASSESYKLFPFYFNWFDKTRVKSKIKAKILVDKNSKLGKVSLSEIRTLPEDYSSQLAINIFGEKVAIILWDKEHPFAVLIKNKKISEGYRKQFEMLWKISKTNK